MRSERRTEFWWKNLKVTDSLEDLGENASMILKRILHKEFHVTWTRIVRFRIELQRAFVNVVTSPRVA